MTFQKIGFVQILQSSDSKQLNGFGTTQNFAKLLILNQQMALAYMGWGGTPRIRCFTKCITVSGNREAWIPFPREHCFDR
jgi:hypothetical protein